MLANLTDGEIFLKLSFRGIRVQCGGGDLLLFGRFDKLTEEDKAILRDRKSTLLMYFDADGELDYCPDGWPRVRAGPPPANTESVLWL